MEKATAQKTSRTKIRLGFFTGLLLLALIAVLGWQLHRLQNRVAEARGQREELQLQVQMQQQSNDKLQEEIAAGGTQAQMEEIARDELGLVAPGDRVFYDVSN